MEIEAGTILANRYRVQRPLGRGGMGEVFAAENVRTGRVVAVKVLRADTKTKASAVARFRREARAAGSVNSDHVTQVLDVEEDPEHGILIVFELLEGESLIDRLKRTGPIAFDELYTIIEQVWLGLADAHRAGVIHRDLKPSNVFLERRPDGQVRVKILDFGISKLPKEMGGETLTEVGQSLGTFSFMPPEQVGKAKLVDHRADIYATGTLIFQSLTGQLPFVARNVLLLVEMKTKSTARKLTEATRTPVDPRLEAFVAKTLEREVEDRYQTAVDALEAWRALKPGAPTSARKAESAQQPSQASPNSVAVPSMPLSAPSSGSSTTSPRIQGPNYPQQQQQQQQQLSPNQTILVDPAASRPAPRATAPTAPQPQSGRPAQQHPGRQTGGTIAMNENPFFPGRQAAPPSQAVPSQAVPSSNPLQQLPPSSIQRPQMAGAAAHPPLGPLRNQPGGPASGGARSDQVPVLHDLMDTTSDGAATKLLHRDDPAPPSRGSGTQLIMPAAGTPATPQAGGPRAPYAPQQQRGSGQYAAVQPQQQQQQPQSRASVPQGYAQSRGSGQYSAVQPHSQQPQQLQPPPPGPTSQAQPHSHAQNTPVPPSASAQAPSSPHGAPTSSTPNPSSLPGSSPPSQPDPPRVQDDDPGAADPTRLYRPGLASAVKDAAAAAQAEQSISRTTGTTLNSAGTKKKGTSPILFIVGAIVFAIVGFALVALVQYMRTRTLPWR